MLLDTQNLFCENQKIEAGTTYSQNIIAFGKNDVSFAPVLVQAVSDFEGITSLEVKFETDSVAEFSNPIALASSTLTQDKLVAGATFGINFLPKGNKGYMRLCFVAQGTPTKGEITSGVVASNGLAIHEI